MGVVKDLGFALSGGTYKAPQIAVYPLIFCEIFGVYPKKILAVSGAVPTALAYLLQRAKKLPEIWFFEATPQKLYAELQWRRKLRLAYDLFLEKSSGLFRGQFLEEIVDREIDFTKVLDSPTELSIGVMNLHGGVVEWHSLQGRGMNPKAARELVLASMMEPVEFEPRVIDGEQVADAGRDVNFPLDLALEDGFAKILAVGTVPRKLHGLPPARMTIGEVNFRASDIAHMNEMNRKLAALENENAERIIRDEKPIAAHLIIPPPDALFFQKSEKAPYGDPSPEARMEMLIIGMAAIPALAEFFYGQGILEYKIDCQPKTGMESFRQHWVFGKYFS